MDDVCNEVCPKASWITRRFVPFLTVWVARVSERVDAGIEPHRLVDVADAEQVICQRRTEQQAGTPAAMTIAASITLGTFPTPAHLQVY